MNLEQARELFQQYGKTLKRTPRAERRAAIDKIQSYPPAKTGFDQAVDTLRKDAQYRRTIKAIAGERQVFDSVEAYTLQLAGEDAEFREIGTTDFGQTIYQFRNNKGELHRVFPIRVTNLKEDLPIAQNTSLFAAVQFGDTEPVTNHFPFCYPQQAEGNSQG